MFFVLNLSIGLSGYVGLDTFKNAIESNLNTRSKAILGADISVGARRALTESEVQIADAHLRGYEERLEVIESFTMILAENTSRLVELKAIEPGYPYYGEIELQKQGLVTGESSLSLFDGPYIWVYPELLLQLGLEMGDSIKLGETQVTVADVILRDGSGVGAGFSFAPPVYIGRSTFDDTQLNQKRSTGYFRLLYKLSEDQNAISLANSLHQLYEDPAVQIRTFQNASEQVGRLLAYLNDYLGLTALVALFLTALGTGFLYRSYLSKRLRDIAILKSFGEPSSRIERLYGFQIIFLGLMAAIPVSLVSYFLIPYLGIYASALIGVEVELQLGLRTLFVALIAGVFGSLLICYPLVLKVRSVNTNSLFQGSEVTEGESSWFISLAYLPSLIIFSGLAVWVSNSFLVGGLFVATLVTLFICFGSLAGFFIFLIRKLNPRTTALKMALRSLSRHKVASIATFLSIAIGTMLLNLIPQLETGIRSEIETPKGEVLPGLFLFDIQGDQVEELNTLLRENDVVPLQISPMVRARLKSVNGESFERGQRRGEAFSREAENENRFRNRGFNLSYREGLSSSESLVSGRLPNERFDWSQNQLPEISLERRFAGRLNLSMGDVLSFDIEGVSIEGVVTSLRNVRWTSFQPNFFVQFQVGALDDAPKTFLATLPNASKEEKVLLQNEIVKKLSNISIIDVSYIIDRLSSIVAQMSIALEIMALFSVIVGLVILFSIASHQAYQRRNEVNLIKVLGGDFGLIRKSFIFEFISLASLASILGAFTSILISYLITKIIFDGAFSILLSTPLLTVSAVIFVSFIVTSIAIEGVVRQKSSDLLKKS